MLNKLKESVKTSDRSRSIFNVIILCATFIIVVSSIYLPSRILMNKSKKNLDDVKIVPTEYYSGPSTAVVKSASRQLTSYQRLQLITNVWDSAISPATEEECSITKYTAHNMALDILSILKQDYADTIQITSYIGDSSEFEYGSYQNWYTWEATPYKALDTTFQTYAAIYWVIELDSFDGKDAHTIVIDESGKLLAIATTKSDRSYNYMDIKPSSDTLSLFNDSFPDMELVPKSYSNNNIDELYFENYHIDKPTDIDEIGINLYSIQSNDNTDETYTLYVIKGDEYFSIFVSP